MLHRAAILTDLDLQTALYEPFCNMAMLSITHGLASASCFLLSELIYILSTLNYADANLLVGTSISELIIYEGLALKRE